MATHTKIRVAIATRKALRAIGRKGESYDAVIRRLIRLWMEKGGLYDSEVMGPLFDMEEEVKE